jgi:hypothetical protein
MGNIFSRHSHRELIVPVAIGSAAAGTLAYLFFTENGSNLRHKVTDRFRSWFSKAEEQPQETPEYLKPKHVRRKTDKEELLHHAPIPENPDITS